MQPDLTIHGSIIHFIFLKAILLSVDIVALILFSFYYILPNRTYRSFAILPIISKIYGMTRRKVDPTHIHLHRLIIQLITSRN